MPLKDGAAYKKQKKVRSKKYFQISINSNAGC